MNTVKKWRCTVCGYIHEGPEPPDSCPVCGAPREKFVEVVEQEAPAAAVAPVVASPSEPREDRDVDRRDVIAALNLEFGANRRYQHQIETTTDPRLASLLRGIMLTEGDHVDAALRYLTKDLGQDGWTKTLLNLKLNRDFEETARDTYLKFASEVRDPELARLFREQAQSEQGHVNIFNGLIKEIEAGTRPVVLWCPLCGWEADFGAKPEPGKTTRCAKCGASVELGVEDGQWTAKLVRKTG